MVFVYFIKVDKIFFILNGKVDWKVLNSLII